ncbi:hypothetical protein RRG08_045528 [Elysia crispata]|uniref:Uncharacterized protein n=1 Tax=Elysia crispata TaxID=231223 RepID=A0AAE0YD21_9GAST|nr:hypothetical protein RRG08_045528 [Elysia crispata]
MFTVRGYLRADLATRFYNIPLTTKFRSTRAASPCHTSVYLLHYKGSFPLSYHYLLRYYGSFPLSYQCSLAALLGQLPFVISVFTCCAIRTASPCHTSVYLLRY